MKCVHLRTALRSAAHVLAAIVMLATCPGLAATAASTPRGEVSPSAADPGFSLCFPYAPKDAGGDNTILYLTSESGTGAAVAVKFVNPDGTQAGAQESYTLTGSETKVVDVTQIGALPAGIHQAVVTSDNKLAGVAHVRNSAWGSIGIYQAADCTQASDEAFGVVYAGGAEGAASVLHVMNGGAAAAKITLEINIQGNPVVSSAEFTLAALGSLRFSTAELPPGDDTAERDRPGAGGDDRAGDPRRAGQGTERAQDLQQCLDRGPGKRREYSTGSSKYCGPAASS